MALGDLLPPSILIWSVVVHLAVYTILYYVRYFIFYHLHLKPATFRTLSEFLFSVAWVILSLEDCVIFNVVSEKIGVTFVGLRLFLFPLTFHKMFGNPCEVIYHYLKRPYRTWKADAFLRPIFVQLLAVPVGVLISIGTWKLLGLVSTDYHSLTEKKIDYFLTIPAFQGFIVEAAISFLMFLPTIFLPGSFIISILETLFIMLLVYNFGGMTGAFMNPMAALACFVMWQSRSLGFAGVPTHLLVFTIAPMMGTVLAVLLAKFLKRRYDQYMQRQALAQAHLQAQARRTHAQQHPQLTDAEEGPLRPRSRSHSRSRSHH